MYPQSAALPADISLQCTDEELCMSLEKILDGSPLPGNVIRDVNPYRCAPSNLPGYFSCPSNGCKYGFWYFIRSSESNPTNIGQWRAKGEASRIFSNSSVYGWRATLEFYQCQTPHETKTNWVMQEYWITQKKSSESSKLTLPVHCQFGWINVQDVWSLCRVFLGDDETPNSNKLQELVNSDRASHSTHSVVPRVENEASNDRETGTLVVTERLPVRDDNVQIMHENDYLSRGDYLELLDLDTPASHSFSSVSSCLTMSSDECFDSLALLEELEPKSKQELVTNNNELVVLASSAGSFDKSRDEERIRNRSPNPGSSVCAKIVTENSSKNMSRKQKSDDRNEGPSNSQNANVGGTKRLKRKKYFCFMPF
ncbi:NAC domain-containing protein 83-like isoform X1 [Pyrus communis]|uniref:NAC domain-containing protein 83-like isoform X1 n=1 Tax=Pyrus communis TaxID=23211 RepID=UPI0035C022C9